MNQTPLIQYPSNYASANSATSRDNNCLVLITKAPTDREPMLLENSDGFYA